MQTRRELPAGRDVGRLLWVSVGRTYTAATEPKDRTAVLVNIALLMHTRHSFFSIGVPIKKLIYICMDIQ